ncbi:hypothetical protein B0H13DRAFT_2511189 [Mycena leptocephala]|nr:hypothetical protein B0H13DRAFT_2511189 [Mycena leptocephala]
MISPVRLVSPPSSTPSVPAAPHRCRDQQRHRLPFPTPAQAYVPASRPAGCTARDVAGAISFSTLCHTHTLDTPPAHTFSPFRADAGAPVDAAFVVSPTHPDSLPPIQPRRSQPMPTGRSSSPVPPPSPSRSRRPSLGHSRPPGCACRATASHVQVDPCLFIIAYAAAYPPREDAPAGGQRATQPHEKYKERAVRLCVEHHCVCPAAHPGDSVHQRF